MRVPFQQWFHSRQKVDPKQLKYGKVVLFPDTTTNYNHPELGIAAVKVIEKMGYEVVIPKTRCCGRPMLSNGMLNDAKSNIDFNIESILTHINDGAKLVGIEPSCVLGFISDFPDLASDRASANIISENTMLIEEFILHAIEENVDFEFENAPYNQKAIFHGHCHQKALVGTSPAMELLQKIPGLDCSEINSGCCGMAGSFGFFKEHYDVSMDIGEISLFPAVREASEDVMIISEGVSCRQQIKEGTGRKSVHLVEVLAKYI